MAITASEAQQFIDLIDRAIGSGALTIEKGDERITYRSYADMMSARAHFENVVNDASDTTPESYSTVIHYRRI